MPCWKLCLKLFDRISIAGAAEQHRSIPNIEDMSETYFALKQRQPKLQCQRLLGKPRYASICFAYWKGASSELTLHNRLIPPHHPAIELASRHQQGYKTPMHGSDLRSFCKTMPLRDAGRLQNNQKIIISGAAENIRRVKPNTLFA
eukprot:1157384-Pelagomonas_calceolata.AAC.7